MLVVTVVKKAYQFLSESKKKQGQPFGAEIKRRPNPPPQTQTPPSRTPTRSIIEFSTPRCLLSSPLQPHLTCRLNVWSHNCSPLLMSSCQHLVVGEAMTELQAPTATHFVTLLGDSFLLVGDMSP